MPNQLYGRLAEKETPTDQAKAQAGQAPALGLGAASIGGTSPQQANSPYANFEDIFNKNKNVAAASADKTVGQVADPLEGLTGRGIQQTLAPAGHAELLGIPGQTSAFAANTGGPKQTGTMPGSTTGQPATLLDKQNQAQAQTGAAPADNMLKGYADPAQPPPAPPANPTGPQADLTGRSKFDALSPPAPASTTGPQADLTGRSKFDALGPPASDPAVDSVLAEIQAANAKDAAALREEEAALGKYRKASDQLESYNQDEGLDLMRQADPNATIWDAALMNQAGGRDAFDTLEQAFGGYDQEYAKEVAKNRDARTAELNALNQKLGGVMDEAKRGAEKAQAQPAGQAGRKGGAPTKSLREMLFAGGDSFWSDMHMAGLTMSPADWASIWGAAETGNDLPMPTETFAGTFDMTGGEIKRTWPQAKLQMAWGILSKEFNAEALAALLSAFENQPGMLDSYLAMTNPGFMLRNMRMWLASAGYTKQNSYKPEIKTTDASDPEAVRRRLAMGYEMTDADGRTWKTLEEYDAAHRGQQ